MCRLILLSAGGILETVLPFSIPIFIISESLGNPALLSSVGARLLLNMKEAGEKGLNKGMGSSIAGVSKATVKGMDFAAPHTGRSVSCEEGGDRRSEEIEMADV